MLLRTIAVLVAFGLAMAGCAAAPRETPIAPEADVLLRDLNAAGDFSGAVMIGRGGAVAFAGAYGRADETRAFALDTAADGASLAKTVTAALVWRLAAAGSLAIDDPVQRHVPEFPYAGVTIRHMLAHTAATPDYDAFQPVGDAGEPMDNRALQDLMRRASATPLRPPGETFAYCNICYDTLALLVERVTGASYAELVAALLGDLGARDAFLRPVHFRDWPSPRTVGFRSARAGAERFDVFDAEALYGGSNIYFSVRDLHAWAKAWVDGRVVPASALAEALAPARIGKAPSAISLTSWYCSAERDRCYYTGHHQGFFNFVYWDRTRRLTAAFVSNSTLAPPLHPWLMRSLVALAEGRTAEPAPAARPEALEIDIAAVAGRYRLAGIGEADIRAGEATPVVRIDGGPQYDLYPVGHGTLYAPGLDAYLMVETRAGVDEPVLLWASVLHQAEAARSPE